MKQINIQQIKILKKLIRFTLYLFSLRHLSETGTPRYFIVSGLALI